jgi:hypothetical protein
MPDPFTLLNARGAARPVDPVPPAEDGLRRRGDSGAGGTRAQQRTHGTEPLRHTPPHGQALRLRAKAARQRTLVPDPRERIDLGRQRIDLRVRPLTRTLSVLLVALLAASALAVAGSASAARSAPVLTLTTGTKTYRGTGITSLGALGLRRTARVTWRHPSGGRLKLETGPRSFPLVTTVKRSGSIKLRAGTYRELRVATRGGWRIDISILSKR